MGRPVAAESDVAALPVMEAMVADVVAAAVLVPVAVSSEAEAEADADVDAVLSALSVLSAVVVAAAEDRFGRASVVVVAACTPFCRAAKGARKRGRAVRLESLMLGVFMRMLFSSSGLVPPS